MTNQFQFLGIPPENMLVPLSHILIYTKKRLSLIAV